ncbi:hypothetical protein BCR42DRAFT_426175 [Absidia repens]|uniref:F-box domain-containing protein n=1 Tax=Absidia repens TaxID=90262 RepID=A0A1X2I1G8_9FUNG|nr:hypothetical protein BCR42DRAFT_426175 [Absidia repens]
MEWPRRTGKTSDIPCFSADDEYRYSHFTRGDAKKVKSYIKEILQHEQRTIEMKPDGTVIITPHLRQLPNEILAHIINHVLEVVPRYAFDNRRFAQQQNLYACTLVNKQFHSIANPLLWQEPVMGFDPTRDLHRLLDCLAVTQQPLGCYVRRLKLKNNFCTDATLLLLMSHLRRLETLSIENTAMFTDCAPITSISLQHLPRYCSQLTSLNLVNIILSDATIRAIGQHCRRLDEFAVHSSVGLCDDVFSALSNCPLKRLDLSYDYTKGTLTEKMVMDMTHFQDLTDLCLSLFEPSSLIMTLANNLQHNNTTTTIPWRHLKTIKLDLCDDIDDATFICFVKAHPHLQAIRLKQATLTDASLDAIAMSLRDLRQLTLVRVHGISSYGVRRLIQSCQGLVLVQFLKCKKIVATDFLGTRTTVQINCT